MLSIWKARATTYCSGVKDSEIETPAKAVSSSCAVKWVVAVLGGKAAAASS
jgi:hypothetical protein